MGYYSEVFDAVLGAGIFIAASYYFWRLDRRREDSHRIIFVRYRYTYTCSRTGGQHANLEDIVLVGFSLRRWLETCTTFLRGRPSSSSTDVIPTGEAAEPLQPLDWPPPPPPPVADI